MTNVSSSAIRVYQKKVQAKRRFCYFVKMTIL